MNSEMTQLELADKTGVSRQTINAIESGKYFSDTELAFQIAVILNVKLEEKFQYTPQKSKK